MQYIGVTGPPIPRLTVIFFFSIRPIDPTSGNAFDAKRKKKAGDGLRRGENAIICPVKGLELYFNICRLLRIEL